MFRRFDRNHLSQRKVDAEFKKITASLDDTDFPEAIPENRPRFFGQNFSGPSQPLRCQAGPRDYQLGAEREIPFTPPAVSKINLSTRGKIFLSSLLVFALVWLLCFFYPLPDYLSYGLFGSAFLFILLSGWFCLRSRKDSSH